MAISIDPSTFVITVPKADMLLAQSNPIEIRELNLDTFRLNLKDWEDGPGITFLKTHNHNTTITVSGVQLARVINMLDPYTITFEDGNYAVNLVGANSNVGDKVNLNQVSVRSTNSAGLIQSKEIEQSSFNGEVLLDVSNGTAGSVYPQGTPNYPVNNITDALLILSVRNLNKIRIMNSITINVGSDISNLTLLGNNRSVEVTLNGCTANNTSFSNLIITGNPQQ